MSGATVALILNLLLFVVLLIGFFIGVVRGAKKQGVRSIYFIGFLIVFLLFSPLISNACLGIQVNGQTLAEFIQDKISANQSVSDMITSNPAIQELITKLPVVIINLAVAFVLVLLALLFSGIAYIITKHVHLNKYKREAKKLKQQPKTEDDKIYTTKDGEPVVIDKVEPKSKRYRWWGGLIGAVTGFVIMFALLLPVTGVARTAMTYIDFSAKADVVAEEKTDEFEYKEISEWLKDSLGKDVVDIMKGVNDSIFIKVTSVGNIDLALFDTISSVKVNGEKITLRNEIKAVADVVESVLYVQDLIPKTNGKFDYKNMDWQTLDFDKLEKSINSLFNSGILRVLGQDLINAVLTDEFVDKNIKETNSLYKYKDYIKELFFEISKAYELDPTDQKAIDQLKNDFLAMLGVAEAVVDSGLANFISDTKTYLDALPTPQTEFDVVVECLNGKNTKSKVANHDYLKDITDSVFKSTTFKGVLVAGVNIGCDELKDYINEKIAKQTTQTADVKFSTVTQENINWTKVSNSFNNLLKNGIEVYKFYQNEVDPIMKNNALTEEQKLAKIAQSPKFEAFVTEIGKIFNNILQSPLFEVEDTQTHTTQNLLDELFTELNKIDEINQYVDLEQLKNINWQNECNNLANAVDVLNQIKVANESVLEIILSMDADKISSSFEQLSKEQIKNILHALDGSVVLNKLTGEFLNQLNKELVKAIDSDYKKNVVDKTTILSSQETTIAKVIFIGLKIKDIDFSTDDVLAHKTEIKAFMQALKENASLSPAGIFADAYTAFDAKLLEVVNDISDAIIDITGDTSTKIENIAVTPQIDAVFAVMELADSLDKTGITTFENIVSDETARGIFVELLTTLQTGDKVVGYIFSTTYETLFSYVQTEYAELQNVKEKTAQSIVWLDVLEEIKALPQE